MSHVTKERSIVVPGRGMLKGNLDLQTKTGKWSQSFCFESHLSRISCLLWYSTFKSQLEYDIASSHHCYYYYRRLLYQHLSPRLLQKPASWLPYGPFPTQQAGWSVTTQVTLCLYSLQSLQCLPASLGLKVVPSMTSMIWTLPSFTDLLSYPKWDPRQRLRLHFPELSWMSVLHLNMSYPGITSDLSYTSFVLQSLVLSKKPISMSLTLPLLIVLSQAQQGICTCCFLFLECSSIKWFHGMPPHSFRIMLKYFFFRPSLTVPFTNTIPFPHPPSTLSWFIFLISTSWPTMLYILFIIFYQSMR